MDETTNKMNTTEWNEDATASTRDYDARIADPSPGDEEDTEQIRAEIEDTRAEMSQTINEIQERLSPENVMDQVKEKVREATIGKVERVMNRVGETISEVAEPAREALESAGSTIKQTGRSAAGVINRNPIPIALIGLGVGLLVMRAYRGGNGYDYDNRQRTSSGMGRQSLTGNQTGSDWGRTRYDLDQPHHTSQSTFNQVRSKASGLAHRSTEALNNLGSQVAGTASSFGQRCGQLLRENPLACGAVAIAAGTAVGLMLPTTRLENEYIGETSERFVDKAQEVAREAIDKVQNAAQQQIGHEA